jgi:NAD(P)-dependent dehydrogenase (short-subunit alcohol dehydrogenase family)
MRRLLAFSCFSRGSVFLSSPESSFVLGHELVVDGGMSQL